MVHIVGATYPTGYNVRHEPIQSGVSDIRANSTSLIFWGSGVGSEIYIEPIAPEYGYSATIQDVTFTLKNSSNTTLLQNSYRDFDTNDTSYHNITDELFIAYRLTSPNPYGITLI